ncbi:hypothetical protein [Streptomyces sp. KL116D]|uniref:hypothetical protein n=1 Tax=Streptomyces sp. KL116D TaxID=3045152 RepID=UPI00355812B8
MALQALSWLTEEGAPGGRRARPEAVPRRTCPSCCRRSTGCPARWTGRAPTPLLTLAAIRPFFAGCTQLGVPGTLVRNYDFEPDAVGALIVPLALPAAGDRYAGRRLGPAQTG